jgi:hypothetical protein
MGRLPDLSRILASVARPDVFWGITDLRRNEFRLVNALEFDFEAFLKLCFQFRPIPLFQKRLPCADIGLCVGALISIDSGMTLDPLELNSLATAGASVKMCRNVSDERCILHRVFVGCNKAIADPLGEPFFEAFIPSAGCCKDQMNDHI